MVLKQVFMTPGALSSVYNVLTVFIPCLISSRGGLYSFFLIISNAFYSTNGIPSLSHRSLSN